LKDLNQRYRKKDKPADILSFSLSKNQGEIFVNLKRCRRDLAFIYIHGLLHLKGLNHGVKMKNKEEAIMKKFKIKDYGK
ncbi:MAG: rRNA maturation RNAse YbeY, partial [Patescibacteria group bacterium]